MRTTRRIARLPIPERTGPHGLNRGQLEQRVRGAGAKAAIEHDLTSAHTGAFPPPPYFADGVVASVAAGRPGYTSLRGDAGVRRALAPRLSKMLGVPVDPDTEIALTAGTQAGLFAAMGALVERGDTILVADPEYLCDERVARFFDATVRRIPFTQLGEDASLDLDAIEAGLRDGARVLIFSNPHNPTGSVMSRASLERIAELAVRHDAWVIADELYGRFVYDGTPNVHLAALPGMAERCITALGPSKTESASGFRIGVMVGPAAAVDAITAVTEITNVRAPAYSQYALEQWLLDDEAFVRGYLDRYRALREITLAALAQVDGLVVHRPAATAWLFPDVGALGSDDLEATEALMRAGILVMPGGSFGPAGDTAVRMCFGQPEETWPAAAERIAEVFESLRRD